MNDAAARAGEEYRKRTGSKGRSRQFAKYNAEARGQKLSEEEVKAYHNLLHKPTYKQLERIFYAYVVFVVGNVIVFCIDWVFDTSIRSEFRQWFEITTMYFGMGITAFYIHAVYKGLKFGVFQGLQHTFALFTFLLAFADESGALLAKFNKELAAPYTRYILPLSAPFFALSSIALVLSEPNARRARKIRISAANAEYQKALLKIQKKKEEGNAIRRERQVRRIAVKLHSMKLYFRTVWHSIWNGDAMTKAGEQGLNLVRDVVKSNKYHVQQTSGDGQSTNPDDIVVTAGKS